MSLAEQHLLIDAANLSLLLFGVALLAARIPQLQAYVVASRPLGQVRTDQFGLPEFLTATILMLVFSLSATYPEQNVAARFLIFIVAGVLVYLGGVRRINLVDLFGLERHDLSALTKWVVPAFVASTLITFLVMWVWQSWITGLIGEASPQESIQMLRENQDIGFRMTVFVTAAIFAPITEELLFRGFLYPAVKRYLQPVVAAIVVSVVFAVVHANVAALLPLVVLSALLILAYELSGTLWVPILVHAGFNALNIVITIFTPEAANG